MEGLGRTRERPPRRQPFAKLQDSDKLDGAKENILGSEQKKNRREEID